MKTLSIRFVLRAPLSHGAFGEVDAGNTMLLRREPIVSLPGHPRVPVVSGNSIRGITRRLLMRELLDAAGVTRQSWAGMGKSRAWDRLYGALANGGAIEKADGAVKPDRIRELRASIPPLSVYGAACYGFTLSGRMSVGFAWPVCVETVRAGLVPAEEASALRPAEDLVHENGYVRHPDKERHDTTETGAKPMPYTVECLSTGVRLVSTVTFAPEATDVEISAVEHAVSLISGLGGRSSIGLGAVHIEARGPVGPEVYRDWLAGAGSALAEALGALGMDL